MKEEREMGSNYRDERLFTLVKRQPVGLKFTR